MEQTKINALIGIVTGILTYIFIGKIFSQTITIICAIAGSGYTYMALNKGTAFENLANGK